MHELEIVSVGGFQRTYGGNQRNGKLVMCQILGWIVMTGYATCYMCKLLVMFFA